MIVGLDREIKPSWIYETLKIAQPGMSVSELKKIMMDHIIEVGGKEARKKTLTVISRYFLDKKKLGVGNYIIEDSLLLHLSKRINREKMIYIYLYNLLLKSESVRYTTEMLLKRFKDTSFNRDEIREIVYNKFGVRDVSKKFISAYISTFINFGVFRRWDSKTYSFSIPISLDKFQLITFLALTIENTSVNPFPLEDIFSLKYMIIFNIHNLENVITKMGKEYGMYLGYRKSGPIVYFKKTDFLKRIDSLKKD